MQFFSCMRSYNIIKDCTLKSIPGGILCDNERLNVADTTGEPKL